MKTKYKTTKIIALGILIFFIGIPSFCHQDKLEGLWEGKFMDQFRVEIHIEITENMELSGKIKMFDGSTMIQNDELNNIEYDNRMITFMIPAKETAFEGQFNDDVSQFSGDFIFPDGSRHPVHVARKEQDNVEKDSSRSITKGILTEEFSPEQLKEDLIFLRGLLSDMHPQYHLYTSEDAYDALYNSAIKTLDSDLTLGEFYNLTSPIVGKTGCSHTGIRLPGNYIMAQQAYNHYFPIKLFIKEDKAWALTESNDYNSIEYGSEIVRINHVPMENIIARLMSFIPSERYNKTAKYFELNKDFGSYFNLLNNSKQFLIEYIKPGSPKVVRKNIDAVPYASYSSSNAVAMTLSPILNPMIMEQSTAILEIPSFALPDVNEYLNLMDSIFQAIHKAGIHNLVLDLRGNHGGHPIFAAILYAHLSLKDFTYFQQNDEVPEFEPLYKPMEAATNNFKGNCYAIVDGGCLSTTGHLISLLRYSNRAVFIGEEPGSWFYCNDNSKQFKLPNTQMEVNIPQTTFKTAVKGYQMGDTFEVEYPLDLSVEDLVRKSDPWMDYTLNMIRTSNRSL